VKKRFLARLKEDGETLVVKVGDEERDILLAADPEVFFLTPHYFGYPTVLIRLPADPQGAARRGAAARVAPHRAQAARRISSLNGASIDVSCRALTPARSTRLPFAIDFTPTRPATASLAENGFSDNSTYSVPSSARNPALTPRLRAGVAARPA
jgi:hypothetical protein